ncbi:MAG TPA: NAD(P)/FAD-dependent oxidoreductase [Gaiellaceae bacterium]|nr:NAD(P)/FAD-dependent oxidoreductase [Gaiellaceae bacterium]
MNRALVVGSGPNGLAAAIALLQGGVEVEVHEAAAHVGGGLHTEELTLPGFLHDVCATVQPLAAGSPFFRTLDLPVEWVQPGAPAAHPLDDGTAVLLERGLGSTADGLGRDGASYRRLVEPLVEAWAELSPVVLGRIPPAPRRALRALEATGVRSLTQGARAALGDARSVAESLFETERARAWFAGHSAHAMLPLERRPSAGFGLALTVMGHAVGWPFARGGSSSLADALAARVRELGGSLSTGSPVDELPSGGLVLADVAPRELARIAKGRLPQRYEQRLRRYRHGPGAFKVDWALDGPIPWRADDCRRAGTVHLGGTLDEIAHSEWGAWSGRVVERPFVLLVQQTLFDDTRAPEGKHSAWAYCHVPNGSDVDMTDRIEGQVERFAPGFRELVLARNTIAPHEFEAGNRNLVGGDLNGGAMDLGQLFRRPALRAVPWKTPLEDVYLCSAATPPGGGVHGMCGYWAARAALAAAS